jgi:hypothetical protein
MKTINIDLDHVIRDTDLSAITELKRELLHQTNPDTEVTITSKELNKTITMPLSRIHSLWTLLINRSLENPDHRPSVSNYENVYRNIISVMFLVDVILREDGNVPKITFFIIEITDKKSSFRLYPMPEQN